MIPYLRPVPSNSRTRDLEWVAAIFFLGMSGTLAWPGDTLKSPVFSLFHVWGLGESFWTGWFGGIAVLRMAVLYVNGRSPKTPFLRMVGAFIGLVTWTQLGYMVGRASMETYGALTIGVGLFLPLAFIEFVSIVRARLDARYLSGR